MIVTCEACTTSFQLDEARIPPGGARVRCSRCKHAFVLSHPSDSSPEALHRIASETAADAAPGVPRVSADLPERGSGSQPGSGATADPDEEDWQFNAEVRVPGDDDGDAEGTSDFDASSDFGEDFDAASIPADGNDRTVAAVADDEGAQVPSTSEDTRDESSFGAVDDFSSWMEDEESADASSTALEIDEESGELGPGDAEVGVYSARGGAEDLGDPASWDLIGDAAATASRRSMPGIPGPAHTRGSRTPLAPSPEFLDQFGEPSFADDLEEERGPLQTAALRMANALGWGVTLALVGAAAFALLQPEWARRSTVAQRVQAGPFVVETSGTSWVETSRMGTLLLVQGRSSNAGSAPIWPRPVQIALLDGVGRRLAVAPVRAGATLPESVLRESRPEALEAARVGAMSAFASEPLAPGESRAFEAVVTQVPAEARRILLQIADSEPLPHSDGSRAILAEPEPRTAPVDQLGRVDDSFEASP